MVKYLTISCLLIMFGLGLLAPSQIDASTPTPTRTLIPLQPSATSQTLFLRPTPTLYDYPTPAVAMPMGAVTSQLGPGADQAIQLYNQVNRNHAIDMVAGAIVAIGGFLGLFALWKNTIEED